MKPLHLTADLLTDYPEIDEQHAELFVRTNRLVASDQVLMSKEEFKEALFFLRDYVREHFAAEQKLMEIHGYPGRTHHEAQHKMLVDEFTDIVGKLRSEGLTKELRLRVYFLMSDKFVLHIRNVDKKLAMHVQKQIGEMAED